MNENQSKALKGLEATFKKCRAAGIAFCGMDCDLLAYDKAQLIDAEKRLKCMYAAQEECGHGTTVNTHGTYVDSGGW